MVKEHNLTDEEIQRLIEQRQQEKNESSTQQQELHVAEVKKVEELPVTSLEDLKTYSKGMKVRFPDFAEGQPFVARVRRPSMLALTKSGAIPNSLLASATSLFTGSGQSQDDSDEQMDMMAKMYDVIEIIAEAALIEPTLDDVKEAGLELTDTQLMTIFNYSQQGTRALDSFRKEQGDS